MKNKDNVAPMHEYLTGFEKYNVKLPFYIDDFFTQNELDELNNIVKNGKNIKPYEYLRGEKLANPELAKMYNIFAPKEITNMSRMLLEFEFPNYFVEKLDNIAKPLYKDDIKLTHWNYIEYNLKYNKGSGVNPNLPPHIDADENLITINCQINSNVDWDIVIDGTRYSLKNNQAIIFAAVNQVHWRPKKIFKEGEFVEILSIDYCPPNSYRHTNQMNPIDAFVFPEMREKYGKILYQHPRFQAAWKQYNLEGFAETGLLDYQY
jgi:hypothetical protein